MRKIKLYIATSLNGKITSSDGSLHWLESFAKPKENEYHQKDFYNSIDTTIQGKSTYNKVIDLGLGFLYEDKDNYVITDDESVSDSKNIHFIKQNHIEAIKKIKSEQGKDIWLVGGGKANTLLLNAGLIDEIHVLTMPIIVPDGMDFLKMCPQSTSLDLIYSKTYKNGAVESRYQINLS